MSNQEAITLLRNLEDSLDSYCELNEEGKTAFRMAIEALNCSEFPNSSDTISRQHAIDALVKAIREDPYYDSNEAINGLGVCDVRVILNDLPSAQPDLDSAYTEGYTQAEAKYRALWDEMPEIIRCKDCVHSMTNDYHPDKPRVCFKTRMCGTVRDDWFCADAERREE